MIKPFFQYAGGKTRIIDVLVENFPSEFDNYVEPFLGGGALFLKLAKTKKCFVNDVNKKLINAYRAVACDADRLYQGLSVLKIYYDSFENIDGKKHFFEEIKESYNDVLINDKEINFACASWFVFLCNTCFNGLYRENNKGGFNASFGKSNTFYFLDKSSLVELGDTVKKHCFYCSSYEDFISNTVKTLNPKSTFIYFDPPYIGKAKCLTKKYSGKNFSLDDNKKLFDIFCNLDSLGYKVMMTQQFVEDGYVVNAYKNFNLIKTSNKSNVCSDINNRGKTIELIIKNY